jgi:hypothetical protein
MKDARYWINEVDRFLQCIEGASIAIGEALKHLRGDKYKKTFHLWKQDPERPEDLTTFDEYCQWKWHLSKTQIDRYIRAYELVEDLKDTEEVPVGTSSPETTEERVLRPLTQLKKEERQKGWELANRFAKTEGKKLTSNHTARAVIKIQNDAEDEAARVKDWCVEMDKANRAKLELVQAENLGIAQGRAQAKVTDCLDRLFQDENEKAKLYLARLLANRLFEIYPQLLDEPIRSFSLKEAGS